MVGNCVELYRAIWLTNAARLVSLPGDGVLAPIALVILVSATIYFYKKDKVFALILIAAPLLGNAVKSLLKNFFAIPRPESFGCDVLTTVGDRYSLPSGHTTFYVIFFGLLVYYAAKNWQELWAKFVLPISIFMMLSIGYSRIYLGAHWYLDILSAYIVGGSVLAIAILVYEYIQKRPQNV